MSFSLLRSEIQTRLNTLVGAGQPLVAVYDIHTAPDDGYPYATFQPTALRSEMILNTDVKYEFEFKIVIHSEIPKGGRDNALTILTSIADTVSAAFDSDYTASGVDFIKPMDALFGQYAGPDGPVEMVEFTFIAVVETTRL